MKRVDPDVVFIVALCAALIALACLLSCGGGQRRDCADAANRGGAGMGQRQCQEVGR